MFLRRKKKAPAEAEETSPRRAVPEGVPVPRHIGDFWHILQDIARAEDPRFAETNVVEHFNTCAEGQRDVARWLGIYQRRIDPSCMFSFPSHYRRHRGHVLIPRNWPAGVLWEAFDERTWFRAPLAGTEDEESLVRAVDAWLDGKESAPPIA